MNYELKFNIEALSDIEKHKKAGNLQLLKKIDSILTELRQHPKTGTGRPTKKDRRDIEDFGLDIE